VLHISYCIDRLHVVNVVLVKRDMLLRFHRKDVYNALMNNKIVLLDNITFDF
jgi:hypothetical protein